MLPTKMPPKGNKIKGKGKAPSLSSTLIAIDANNKVIELRNELAAKQQGLMCVYQALLGRHPLPIRKDVQKLQTNKTPLQAQVEEATKNAAEESNTCFEEEKTKPLPSSAENKKNTRDSLPSSNPHQRPKHLNKEGAPHRNTYRPIQPPCLPHR